MRLVEGGPGAPGPRPIQVLLALQFRLYRRGLQALIANEPDMVVAGEASDGRAAVQQALALRPDVVLLDLTLPGLDLPAATQQILDPPPAPRILLLAHPGEEARAIQALASGAHSFVLKSAPPEQMLQAIRALARGDAPLPCHSAPLPDLVAPPGAPPPAPEPGPAPGWAPSPRDLAVLELIAQGRHNREIARAVGCTEKIVKRTISVLLNQWQLDDRTQAVIYAVQHGILDPETIRVPAPGSVERSA